ncbi:MAG TPA: hypothetical protein VJ969_01725 [Desulfopila sp.]|nr:hypothetical protein [Desulfopila sp.]
MEKTSAEGVLKNTFEYLDKVVDEKNAGKSTQADRADGDGRSRRKTWNEDDDGSSEKDATAAKRA